MSPQFDTCFFERYAKYTLENVLGTKYADLVNADRPDLQDCTQNLGIEVTRAIRENKDVAHALINEMAGKNLFDLSESEIVDIQRTGYAYGLDYTNNLIGTTEYKYWSLALPLKRILENKVAKVANGFYGQFNEFGLYVFSKESLTPNEVATTMDYVLELQISNQIKYSKLYLSQIQQLFVCDLKKQTIDEFQISTAQCRQFYYQAIKVND